MGNCMQAIEQQQLPLCGRDGAAWTWRTRVGATWRRSRPCWMGTPARWSWFLETWLWRLSGILLLRSLLLRPAAGLLCAVPRPAWPRWTSAALLMSSRLGPSFGEIMCWLRARQDD